MIPLGVIASSRVDTQPEEPTDVTQVSEWSISTATGPATGQMTTLGNFAFVRCVHRAGANGLPATISDNGGNLWKPLGTIDEETDIYRGTVVGGSGDIYIWYAENILPMTEVSVLVDGNSATSRYISVVEWAGIAKQDALIDSNALHNPSQTGTLPSAQVDNTVPGALILGALAATVSNRTFDLTPDSKAAGYVAGFEHRANQSTLIGASRTGAPVGLHGPQWILSGNASTTGVVTAAFRPG